MQFPPLPADADDAARLAHAGFALSMLHFQFARVGSQPTQETWDSLVANIIQQYGQGDSPAAAWIRQDLGPIPKPG
jgi:hypothetical protein